MSKILSVLLTQNLVQARGPANAGAVFVLGGSRPRCHVLGGGYKKRGTEGSHMQLQVQFCPEG